MSLSLKVKDMALILPDIHDNIGEQDYFQSLTKQSEGDDFVINSFLLISSQ